MICKQVQLIKIICLIFVMLSFSCSYVHDKEGLYVAKNFEYTIDTLKVYSDGNYEHIIYDKQKSKLININKGDWEYSGDRLVFNEFLVNEDDLRFYNDSVKYENVLMTCYLSMALFSNEIIIDYDLDKYYEKVQDY